MNGWTLAIAWLLLNAAAVTVWAVRCELRNRSAAGLDVCEYAMPTAGPRTHVVDLTPAEATRVCTEPGWALTLCQIADLEEVSA